MKKLTSLLLCISFLTACSGMQQQNVQMSFDANAPFSRYKSFNIQQFHVANHFMGLNALIDEAVVSVLTEKGLSYSESKQTDLLVRYGVKVDHSEQFSLIDWNLGNLGNAPEVRVQIDPVHKGSLLVNILDQQTGEAVWKASSVNIIFSGMNIESITQAQITKAIEELFENYPSK